MEDSERLSAHLEHIWDDYDLEDLEVCYSVCGRIEGWAHEIRQLEDQLDRCKQAVTNLGGRVD
jgi:hypothetical protein